MHITLAPQRRDDSLTLHRSGGTLTINGTAYDFGILQPGDTLLPEGHGCEWIVGPVRRDARGTLHLTLILPHGPNAAEAQRFPDAITNPADGEVALP